jgi:RHH-type transcriptional regulator, rel operon repressor / antitoxin RelB
MAGKPKRKSPATALTVQIPAPVRRRLDKIAADAGTDIETIVVRAVSRLVEADDEYLRELDLALAEADRGEFATDAETAAFFARFGLRE